MKCIRVIEYEAETKADIDVVLSRSLLTAQAEIKAGDVVPGRGPIHAAKGAPQVTLRLAEERWE